MSKHHRHNRVHVPDWRKYTTRRVIIVVAFAACGYAVEYLLHLHSAGKGGEMLIGAVVGHWLLEVEA